MLGDRNVFCPRRCCAGSIRKMKQLVKEILSVHSLYLGKMVMVGIKTHMHVDVFASVCIKDCSNCMLRVKSLRITKLIF